MLTILSNNLVLIICGRCRCLASFGLMVTAEAYRVPHQSSIPVDCYTPWCSVVFSKILVQRQLSPSNLNLVFLLILSEFTVQLIYMLPYQIRRNLENFDNYNFTTASFPDVPVFFFHFIQRLFWNRIH